MSQVLLYNFDEFEKMAPYQLERAWLGCIAFDPSYCRTKGLLGLDESMFEDRDIFALGLWALRENYQEPQAMPEALLAEFSKRALFSELWQWENELRWLTSFYRLYSREIEKRSDEGLEPEWKKGKHL